MNQHRETWRDQNDDDPADDDDEVLDGDDDVDYGDDDEGEPTIACPWCREEIHEDSPQCPHCHNFISSEDGPPRPRPAWFVIGVILGLLVILSWIAM